MEYAIIINDSYPAALEIAEKFSDRISYLPFEGIAPTGRPHNKIVKLGQFDLIDHIRSPAGTQCYFITPKAARIFLEHADV